MNKTNPIRLLTAVFLLLMFALPLSAQQTPDSLYMYRFHFGRDFFYSPGLNNGVELARLYATVDRYKDLIKNHKIMMYVNGYCNSRKTKADNLYLAKRRSNRVKS